MTVQIQIRRGSAQQWFEANPILAEGELAVELDTDKFKIGNGITYWNDLPYSSGTRGPQGVKGDPGINTISDIPDVDTSDLVNGSILMYNSISNKWVSSSTITGQTLDSGQY